MLVKSYLLDSDSITTDDLLESEVTEDNVFNTLDGDGEVFEDDLAVLSDNRLIAANLDVVTGALDGPSNENDSGVVALDGSSELVESGDLDGLTALTTSGTAIGGSVTNSGDVLKGSSTLLDAALDIDHARGGRCQSGDGCKAKGDNGAELHCVEVLTSSRKNDWRLKRRTGVLGLEKEWKSWAEEQHASRVPSFI